MKKNTSISIRLPAQEKNKIQKKAELAGISVSEYVRFAAVRKNGRIRKASQDQVKAVVQIQTIMQRLEFEIKEDEPDLAKMEKLIKDFEEVKGLWKL